MKIALVGTHGLPARCGGVEACSEQIEPDPVKFGDDTVAHLFTAEGVPACAC